MRLFVAVDAPQAALDELAAAVRPLRRLAEGRTLRWTAPETWHLTLAFLGEVDEESLPELERRLALAAHRHPVHRVRFEGGGRFGDRALWAGVGGDTLRLRRLAESVQAAARRAGLEVDDDRPYRAHLTLARSNVPRRGPHRGGDRYQRPDLRDLKAELEGFEGREWQVADIRLMRSVLGSDASSRYTALRSWPLEGPEDAPEDGPVDEPGAPPE